MQNYMISKLFQDYRHDMVRSENSTTSLPGILYAVMFSGKSIVEKPLGQSKLTISGAPARSALSDGLVDINPHRLVIRDFGKVFP